MRRITFLQFAIYDSTSQILTAARNISTNARNDPLIFLVIFPYLTIATFFLSILCPKLNLQNFIISAILLTALYHTTGALVPLLEEWALKHRSSALDLNHSTAAEIRWSSTKTQVTHSALSWFFTGEINHWCTWFLAQRPEPRPKHPDSFLPNSIRSSAAWYARIHPSSSQVSEVNLAVPGPARFDWHYLAFAATLQALSIGTLGATFWCLRHLINPRYSGSFTPPMGFDTIITSGSGWGHVVNFVLARPVRVVHAGVFEGVVELLEELLEERRSGESGFRDN
jgi:hypothetical protein